VAITVEQRAAIKKRAQELLASPNPPTMGAAAQQAYTEIVGTEPTKVAETAEAADVELQKRAVTDYGVTRSKFVAQKKNELTKTGYNELEADTLAQDEWDRQYGAPQISPYDEQFVPLGIPALKVKPAQPITSDIKPATISGALRPQTAVPESGAAEEKKRATTVNVSGAPGGLRINYPGMIKQLEDSGLTRDDATKQAKAFQAAFGQNLVDISAGYKNKQLLPPPPDKLAQEAFDKTLTDLGSLSDALTNKEMWTKDKLKVGGPVDPLNLAFSNQIETGEGVPTLTAGQAAYIKRAAEDERTSAYQRLKKEYEGKDIIVPDPTASEVRGGTKRMVKLPDSSREDWLQAKAASEVEIPWWTDPAEVRRRQIDPQRGIEGGAFRTTTSLGSEQETNIGWLLRSGMAPYNAIAGWAFPIAFTGFDAETRAAVEEARRAGRPQAYKDSPILLNIAQGRGFIGEAKEVSKITGIDKEKLIGPFTVGDLYEAGAFAADMLDPTLDLVAGAIKGGKVASQVYKLSKELGAGVTIGEAAKLGAKVGAEQAVRESALLNRLVPKKVENMLQGDVRLLITNKLATEAEAALGVGPRVGTEFDKEAVRLGSESKAIENAPIIKSTVDDVQSLRNSINNSGKEISSDLLEDTFNEAVSLNPEKFGGKGGSYDNIINLLRENPDLLNDFEKVLIRKTIRANVYEHTKDTLLHSGIVALTPNTFISPSEFDKIASKWKQTEAFKGIEALKNSANETALTGKLSSKLKGKGLGSVTNITYTPSDSVAQTFLGMRKRALNVTPVEGYLTSDKSLYNDFLNSWRVLYEEGATTSIPELRIVRNADGTFKAGFIPLKDVREFVNINLDEIARSMPSYVSSKDVTRLTPLVAKETTKPIELRDVGFAGFNKWKQDNIKKPSIPLTPAQEGFIDEVTSKLTGLDKRLRSDMQAMVSDPNFRAAYGIPAGENLTRKELVGYLVVGPRPEKHAVEDTLKSMANQVFSSKHYEPSIFNNIDGIDRKKYTSIWSFEGDQKLDAIISKAADSVILDPKSLETNLNNVIDSAREIVKDEKNIIVGKDEIVDGLGGKAIPNEMIVASYYNSEARRIYNEALVKIVQKSGRARPETTIRRLAGDEFFDVLREGNNFPTREESLLQFIEQLKADGSLTDPNKIKNIRKDLLTYGFDQNTIDKILPAPDAEQLALFPKKAPAQVQLFPQEPVATTAKPPVKEAEQMMLPPMVNVYERFSNGIANYIDNIMNNANFSKKSASEIIDIIEPEKTFRKNIKGAGLEERYLNVIRNEAEYIMKNNGFVARDNGLDELLSTVREVYTTDNPKAQDLLRLSLGDKTSTELLSRLNEGGIKDLEKSLRDVMTEPVVGKMGSVGAATTKIVNGFLETLRGLFYTALLGAAPRFHGVNMLSAPIVIYSTTGKIVDPTNVLESMATIFASNSPVFGAQAIVKDAFGRSYTANELWRAFSEGAAKSNWQVQLPSVNSIASNAIVQSGAKGEAGRALNNFLNLPNNEDLMWRMAVGIGALKEGRSMDEAIKLAREALFNVSNITKAEKQIQNYTLFYNFNRNNLVNLVKNLTSPKAVKRLVNSAKMKRGVENLLGIPEQEKQYAPTTAATRWILERGVDLGDRPTLIVSPGDPQLQAFEMLSNIIGLNPAVVTSMLRPGLKEIGQEIKDIEQVPAEHVAWYKLMASMPGMGDVSDVISLMAGEKVVPYKSDAPDAVDGYVYPLLTEKARDNYTFKMNALGYLGLSRIISDYPQTVAAEGTKTSGAYESAAGLGSYAIGATTPIKNRVAEQQRLKQVLAQTSDGRKIISDIDDAIVTEIKADTSKLVTPEKAELKAQSKEFKKEYAKEFNSLSDFDREEYRIGNEVRAIQSQMRKDPGNYDAYEQKLMRLENEYNELDKKRSQFQKAMKQGK